MPTNSVSQIELGHGRDQSRNVHRRVHTKQWAVMGMVENKLLSFEAVLV